MNDYFQIRTVSKRRTCDDEDEKMLERCWSKGKSTKPFRWERTGKESVERNGKIKIDLLWSLRYDGETCQDRIRDVCSYRSCIWWWRTTMKPPKSTNDPRVGDDSIMEMKFAGQNKSFDRVGSTYDPTTKSVRKAHSEVVKQLCRLYYEGTQAILQNLWEDSWHLEWRIRRQILDNDWSNILDMSRCLADVLGKIMRGSVNCVGRR